jgi:hypothetical protein
MPFQSEKQRRYMHANLPEIANRWEKKYGLGGIAELNAQLNSLPEYYLPKNQGGRIGYEKGLKVLPKIDITQSSSTPSERIDVDVRDITYGGSGLYQGDKWYAGGDFQTGNVNVKVQEDGNTVFHDTMSKDDLKKLYVGLGQKEGDKVEVGTDRKGNYTLNIVKSFNHGGLIPSHEAGIYGLAEGGRTGFFTGAQADTASGKSMSPGTSASGGTRNGGPGPDLPPQLGGPSTVEDAIKFRDTPPEVNTGDVDEKITIDELYERSNPKKTRAQLLLGKLQAKYPKFFQLDTAKKLNQIKNMSWKDALNLEKQMSKSLFGKGYTGLDKVKTGKYFGEGIKSLFLDPSKWSSKIGGATPLAKKLAVLAGEKVLPTVMGGSNILGAPLAYVQGASMLQNFLESQGMLKGALGDDILARGVEAAGTDVLSVPDIYESSQDVPPESSSIWEGQKGGIAGLKHGGRIGFFTGMREAEQREQATRGPRDAPDRFGPTPTTTTTTGDGYQDRIIELQDRQRRQDLSDIITREEEEKGGPEYYGLRKLELDQADLQKRIQDKITGDWRRYMDPSTWQKVQNLYAMTNFKGIVQEIFKGIKRTSDMNTFMQDLKDLGLAGGAPGTNDPLYDQLWLHLEKQKGKYRYDDEGGPEGPEGPEVPQETGITYANIENTNREQAASSQWRQEQEKVDRSKQMAYWRMMMAPYMSAQGGRVPAGYNTGGLSNLFKLKNV